MPNNDIKLREATAYNLFKLSRKLVVANADAESIRLEEWRHDTELRDVWRKDADALEAGLEAAGIKLTYISSKTTDKLIAELVTHPARVAYELGNE